MLPKSPTPEFFNRQQTAGVLNPKQAVLVVSQQNNNSTHSFTHG